MVKVIVFEDGQEVFQGDNDCALVILDGEKAKSALLRGNINREGMIRTIGKGIARLLVRTCPGDEHDATWEIGQLIKKIGVEGASEEYKKYVGGKRC